MNEIPTKTWKDWVDWWPTYVVLGVSLAYFAHQSGVITNLKDKFFKPEDK